MLVASHTDGKTNASDTEEQFSSNQSVLVRRRVSSVPFSQAILRGTCNIYSNSALRRNSKLKVLVWLRPKLVNCCFSRASVSSSALCTEACVCKDVFYQAELWVLYPYSNCGSSRCLYTYCRTHLPSSRCGFWLYPDFVSREKLSLKSCGTWSFQYLEGDVSNLTKKERQGGSCRQTNSPEVHVTNSGVMCVQQHLNHQH